MAAARVLHVGDDTCHRIPVMEKNGIVVLHSDASVGGVRRLLASGEDFSGVTFHNDDYPPECAVVSTVRQLSRAPLILLKNPWVECDDRSFDFVIHLTDESPEVWSRRLRESVQEARKTQDFSRQLRQECIAVRDFSQALREMSVRNRIRRSDYDALFRGEAEGAATKTDAEGDGG